MPRSEARKMNRLHVSCNACWQMPKSSSIANLCGTCSSCICLFIVEFAELAALLGPNWSRLSLQLLIAFKKSGNVPWHSACWRFWRTCVPLWCSFHRPCWSHELARLVAVSTLYGAVAFTCANRSVLLGSWSVHVASPVFQSWTAVVSASCLFTTGGSYPWL